MSNSNNFEIANVFYRPFDSPLSLRDVLSIAKLLIFTMTKFEPTLKCSNINFSLLEL